MRKRKIDDLVLYSCDSPFRAVANDSTLFRKELIYPGKFVKKNDKDEVEFSLPCDEALIDHWVATFNQMRKAGVQVPLPIEHTTDPEARRGTVVKLTKEMNPLRGGKPSLYMYARFRDQDTADALSKTAQVSLFSPPDMRDGTGRKYVRPITHVALTDYPLIPGLAGWEKAGKGASAAASRVATIAASLGKQVIALSFAPAQYNTKRVKTRRGRVISASLSGPDRKRLVTALKAKGFDQNVTNAGILKAAERLGIPPLEEQEFNQLRQYLGSSTVKASGATGMAGDRIEDTDDTDMEPELEMDDGTELDEPELDEPELDEPELDPELDDGAPVTVTELAERLGLEVPEGASDEDVAALIQEAWDAPDDSEGADDMLETDPLDDGGDEPLDNGEDAEFSRKVAANVQSDKKGRKTGDRVETVNGMGKIIDIRNQGGRTVYTIRINGADDTYTEDELAASRTSKISASRTSKISASAITEVQAARRQRLDALCETAKITPAQRDQLAKQFASAQSVSFALSNRATKTDDGFEATMAALQQNRPAFSASSRTGPQQLANERSPLLADAHKRAEAEASKKSAKRR